MIVENLQAEESVLGAVLLSDTALPALVEEGLRREDFYREQHRLIFAAMLDMHERGEPVDALTLVARLDRTGRLEDAGGRAAIELLASSVPQVGSYRQYARIVIDAARERRMRRLAHEVANNGSSPEMRAKLREALDDDYAAQRGPGRVAIDGATFALDAPEQVASVWGAWSEVAWAEGEPLMLYGPDGVGKTTLAQQLVLRRIGIGDPHLLGFPVVPDLDRRVLYLALDRPKQAARSFRRMVREADRETLRERLVVWPGELPFELIREPRRLVAFAIEHDAGTVVVDCVKDLGGEVSEEAFGQAVNRAAQACVEAGVEVLLLHHPRKAQADNKKPKKLADIYGSRWIPAGCGSILLLWGEAGDPIVSFEHLKQPADTIGPLTLLHDNHRGTTIVMHAADVIEIVATHQGPAPAVKDVAMALFKKQTVTSNEVEKARRKLEAAVAAGKLRRLPADPGQPVGYALAGGSRNGVTQGSRGVTRGVTGKAHGAPYVVGARDPGHVQGHDDDPTPPPVNPTLDLRGAR
jgi:replicative DNA helicase